MKSAVQSERAGTAPHNQAGDDAPDERNLKSSLRTEIPLEAQASLERLMSSESIARAPRVSAVLKFMIDSLLHGKATTVNEEKIGQAVFGRPAGYNPAEDNIVRVTIRHLRVRLEDYYRTEGRNEAYILEIPKGKYIPTLVPRAAESSEALRQESDASRSELRPNSVLGPNVIRNLRVSEGHWKIGIPWILTAALLVITAIMAFNQYQSSKTNGTGARSSNTDQGVLQLLVQPGNRITVVVADSNLQAYRSIFGKQVPLDAYINHSFPGLERGFPDSLMTGVKQYVTGESDTTVTSAITAAAIQKAALPAAVEIRHPRDLSMREFQRGNLILLGGPWINPWGQLFEDQLNYRILPMISQPALSEVHNVNPLPGEPKVFTPSLQGNPTIGYARIAMLPNLSGNGRVVLIGATDAGALEAGGDFIGAPASMRELLNRFKSSAPTQLPYFELVLEVKGHGSVPGSARIVALRSVSHPS